MTRKIASGRPTFEEGVTVGYEAAKGSSDTLKEAREHRKKFRREDSTVMLEVATDFLTEFAPYLVDAITVSLHKNSLLPELPDCESLPAFGHYAPTTGSSEH